MKKDMPRLTKGEANSKVCLVKGNTSYTSVYGRSVVVIM